MAVFAFAREDAVSFDAETHAIADGLEAREKDPTQFGTALAEVAQAEELVGVLRVALEVEPRGRSPESEELEDRDVEPLKPIQMNATVTAIRRRPTSQHTSFPSQ